MSLQFAVMKKERGPLNEGSIGIPRESVKCCFHLGGSLLIRSEQLSPFVLYLTETTVAYYSITL